MNNRHHDIRVALVIAIAALFWAASGCNSAATDLSDNTLKNTSYRSDSFEGLTVRLENGRFKGRMATDESMEFEVGMLPEITRGRLNGRPAAAVILFSNSGGSGTFIDLAIVMETDGKVSNVATVNLGDRIKVNHCSISQDTIMVDMLAHGPDDPLCCPSLNLIRKFTLEGSMLNEARPFEDE